MTIPSIEGVESKGDSTNGLIRFEGTQTSKKACVQIVELPSRGILYSKNAARFQANPVETATLLAALGYHLSCSTSVALIRQVHLLQQEVR